MCIIRSTSHSQSVSLHSHHSKVHSLSIDLRLAPVFLVLLLPFLGRLGNTLSHLPYLGPGIGLQDHVLQFPNGIFPVLRLGAILLRGHCKISFLIYSAGLILLDSGSHFCWNPSRIVQQEAEFHLGVDLIDILPTCAGRSNK